MVNNEFHFEVGRKSKRFLLFYTSNPVGIYLLKVNNRNARTGCEICSKLTIKTTVLVFLLLTFNMQMPTRTSKLFS